jgi:hypothetical protein
MEPGHSGWQLLHCMSLVLCRVSDGAPQRSFRRHWGRQKAPRKEPAGSRTTAICAAPTDTLRPIGNEQLRLVRVLLDLLAQLSHQHP